MAEKPLKKIENLPVHVAIIMDGNGRWAKARGLPRVAGHRAGTENLRNIISSAVEFGVKYLTLYAFSTENWGRPQEEVSGIIGILEEVLDRELEELHKQGVKLRHFGHLEGLQPNLRDKVIKAIELTQNNDKLGLNLAFNYGGRDEILCAIRKIIDQGIPSAQINDAVINQNLFTAGIPDPDLIIRTSGEMRTSNFLIWQAAYAEWYAPATLWPDFNRVEFYKALEAFSQRDRRFGKLSAKETQQTSC